MGTSHELPLLAAGQRLGGCQVVRLLGRGGMGEVYLAQHCALQKLVALKILPPDLVTTERVERFFKEARTCARIEHPNVIVIHDVGEQSGLYYIVMQYVQGQNLAQLVRTQGGPLPRLSAVRIMQLAAWGLESVHNGGLVHRDVKPSNIMLSTAATSSRVILMDFGLVREEMDSGLTRTGEVVGTPAYMSPEQCQGKRLDRRSDIYSMGGTLYCLLSGRPPFKGGTTEVVAQIATGARPKPLHELNAEVPPEVSELIAKRMMAPRPEDRYPTAAAVASELKRLLRLWRVKETSTWHPRGELSQTYTDTRSAAAPPPVELLPLETTWDSLRTKLPWIGMGAGVLACVLLVSLLMHSLFGNRGQQKAEVPPQQKAAGQEPAKPPVIPPAPAPDRSNMVQIPAGYARLGNSPVKLRAYFQAIPELAADATLLQQAIMAASEEPQRRDFVAEFWIDVYEVTNREYARFLNETKREPPDGWERTNPPPGKEDHPVENVRHRDAEAYAQWAHKKLPTREQWMRAFRGDEEWLFPWGDTFEPTRANVQENKAFPTTSPVTATPGDRSSFGVYNLVGNVCEFIRDKETVAGQTVVVVKGAHYGAPGWLRGVGCMHFRVTTDLTSPGFGFRCVVEKE